MKRILTTMRTGVAAGIAALTFASAADAAGGDYYVTDYAFPFEGPFGTYDQLQLQRGLKVYTEVCSACHGLKYVPFRDLASPTGVGFTEDQAAAYAAQFEVFDPSLNDGLGDFREAVPADNFPENNAVGAPDLSLMAKARAGFHGPYGLGTNQLLKGMGGPEYIASLLMGYTGEEMEQAGTVLYENTAFPGGWISMAPVIYGDDVEFDDGAPTDAESIAKDVSAFLMWTAEPKLAVRKQTGLVAVLMLGLLSVLLYFTNKALWRPVKAHAKYGSKIEPAE